MFCIVLILPRSPNLYYMKRRQNCVLLDITWLNFIELHVTERNRSEAKRTERNGTATHRSAPHRIELN